MNPLSLANEDPDWDDDDLFGPVRTGVLTATAEPAPAPAAVLTPDRLSLLAAVFADAIEHRYPATGCTDCDEETGELCGDHQADLEKADAYCDLRDELGIEER